MTCQAYAGERDLRGNRTPVNTNVQASAAQMANPGTKLPSRSREAPTTIGAMNMPKPAMVREAPQTTVILRGVIQGNCMGKVKRMGW